VIVLDENLIISQHQLLHSWRIAARQIGLNVGYQGLQYDEIIPLLHTLRRAVFSRATYVSTRAKCHTPVIAS